MKGVLIKAAQQGYITQVACKMPECFCPEELGGACYFVHSAQYSDWNPTHEHSRYRRRTAATEPWTTRSWRTASAIAWTTPYGMAVRTEVISERIKKARDEAIRRNNEGDTEIPN